MVVIHRITLKNANKMKKIFFCMLALVAAMLGSCVSDEEVRIMPEFSYSDNEVLLPRAEGSSYTAPIATTEPVVTAEYNCEWLSVEVNTRHAIFTTLSENAGEENRSTEVILRAGDFMEEVTVTQQCLEVADNGLVVGQQTEDGLGMIFWVDPENPTAGKAISLQRLEGKAFELSPKYHEATSLIDGKANTALFEEHTAEEAAGYCKSLGEGWYLPARYELHELFAAYNGVGFGEDGFTDATPDAISDKEKQARAAFDKLLTDLGGTIINKAATGNGDSYWSSTESDAENAWVVRFGKWADAAYKKTGTSRFVRCMYQVGDFVVPEEPATISLSTQSIALEAEAGSAGATTVTSNKDLSTIAVVIADPSWVGYAVADGVVTFTASSANETDAIRSTTATITVGAGENTATATVTISQAKKITVEPWKLGEVVPDTDKSKGGIVVWVDPTDGTRAKIVSMKREKIAWGDNTFHFGTPTNGDEGSEIAAIIMAHAQASTCTILTWAQSLGEGWYIPTRNELTLFYDYYNGNHNTKAAIETLPAEELAQRDAVEKIFADAGADPVCAAADDPTITGSKVTGNGEGYWSINEKSDGTQAFYVRFGSYNNGLQGSKTGSRLARGMRVVKK